MKHYQAGKYYRVDKRVARRLYNEGKDVLFVPCNMRPDASWGLGIVENKDNANNYNAPFDTLVEYYKWYNCDNYRGRYVSFYEVRI